MSTRDEANLSARERALLANLEAQAAADDPDLAATLRGRRALSVRRLAGYVPVPLHNRWWGALLVAAGLALMLASLGISRWVGFAGAVLCALGIWLVIGALRQRFGSEGAPPGAPPPA